MTIEAELAAAREIIRDYESRIHRLTERRTEPIAIVGAGLRLPGGSTTLGGLTEYLASGRSATGPIPEARRQAAEFARADSQDKGRISSASGGFLDEIDLFDAPFFNISPKEARCIDPQQRIALETSWEALENANIDPTRLRRGNVGVYFGASSVDFAWEVGALAAEDMEGYLASGVLNAAVAGRISYFLGARGPSMSIDTACSSSLVALHLAVKGLRDRECEIALCGAASVIHHPFSSMLLSDMQALSTDGRCKTFDESADGYGRAEGCGVIVLKRLSDARRDGDTVLALVRGTAVRQDGESAGFTAPNGLAQEALMRAALADAELGPGDVQYVEAHGTGTPLGDPIEMGSIAEVFGPSHSEQDPLLVASLKTNIGHMEGAAGIGGVIKTVLQLRNGTVYPHLNFDKPSSRIAWATWPVRVPTQVEPWRADVRRGLVNSFGFTGTIASAVLEEAPKPLSLVRPAPEPGEGHVLTVSAKSAPALAGQIRRYRQLLNGGSGSPVDVADLCHTTNVGRAHFRHRVSAVVTGRDDLAVQLEELLTTVERGELPGQASRKVGFLFSGLGALRPGIGAGLYRRHEVFAAELDACDEALTPLVGRPVKEMVLGTCGSEDAEALGLARYGQPVQFAIEYALARLWMSWGIRPTSVAGHSMGEIAAGAVAGLFSLQDAATLISARARLMDSVRTPGCMVSVGAGADTVAPLLAGHDDVAVAAVNAPQQCVISGGRASIEAITAELAARDVDFTMLAVSQASHSPLMTEVAEELREEIAGVRYNEPEITLVSTVTGEVARQNDFDAGYWVRQFTGPVNFMAAMRTLDRRGKHVFVEVSPFATLTSLGRRCVPAGRHLWLASMHPSDEDGRVILESVAKAYAAGQPISWPDFHRGRHGRKIELPTYAFDRKPYALPAGVAAGRPVPNAVQAAVVAPPAVADGPVVETLPAIPENGDPRTTMTEVIRREAAAVLGFADSADVGTDVDFTDLGMDSLLAVRFRKELCAALSVTFATPEIFNYPTPRALAEFLGEQLEKVG
ncbi:acyltransferase domain-containing protein [Actinomadura barringtoniae]|uniref:Acyltransferase domain-containing protein n=1 Tax=Actinomadura barringtoniae TaxID=1427535 RepID=A0A939PBQ4_9ACTN|nr:type I polyketide synthase [Actinomadura barringtoniae]MBO2449473.1 acyltransferase domain-containing protein [Actinomadura barringtoniae]